MPLLSKMSAKLYEFKETPAERVFKQEISQSLYEKAVSIEEQSGSSGETQYLYEQAVEYDPCNTSAMVNLGAIYLDANEFEKAERQFRNALAAEPNYYLAHFNLAACLERRGRIFLTEAIEHYLAALELNPNYTDAHFNLAASYEENREFNKAIPHWSKYLKFDRDSKWADIARKCLRNAIQKTGFSIVTKPPVIELGKGDRKKVV